MTPDWNDVNNVAHNAFAGLNTLGYPLGMETYMEVQDHIDHLIQDMDQDSISMRSSGLYVLRSDDAFDVFIQVGTIRQA